MKKIVIMVFSLMCLFFLYNHNVLAESTSVTQSSALINTLDYEDLVGAGGLKEANALIETNKEVVAEATCAYDLGDDKRFVITLKSVNGSVTYTTDCVNCLDKYNNVTYGVQYALESSFSPYNFVDKEKNVFSCVSEIYGEVHPFSSVPQSSIVEASLYLIKPDRNNVLVHKLDPSLSKYPSGKLSAENEDGSPLNVCTYKRNIDYASFNITLRIYKDRIESDDIINLSPDIKPEMFYEECPVLSISGNENTGFYIEKTDNLPDSIRGIISGEKQKTKDDIDKEEAGLEDKPSYEPGLTVEKTCDGIIGKDLLDIIAKYYRWILIIAPILVIVLCSMDFFKAIMASDDQAIKKATKSATTRLIALVILFFIPFFVNLLLSMPGLDGIVSSTCNVESRDVPDDAIDKFENYKLPFGDSSDDSSSSSNTSTNNSVPNNNQINSEESPNVKKDVFSVSVPGIKKNYKIAWISDLHLWTDNKTEVSDKTAYEERTKAGGDFNGNNNKNTLNELVNYVNNNNFDAVIFGGDLIDNYTTSNFYAIKNGIGKINIPKIVLYSDHDQAHDYTSTKDGEIEWSKEFSSYTKVELEPGLSIMGIQNSTAEISEDNLNSITNYINGGNKILLASHVPYIGNNLDVQKWIESKKNGRLYFRGPGAIWDSDGNRHSTIVDMLSSPTYKSKIVGAVYGHVHSSYNFRTAGDIKSHIFEPAYNYRIGIINITK